MAIPIQNIYYLLCYAWDRFEAGEAINVNNLDSTEQMDLFATVLIEGTQRVLRKGLDRSYQTHSEPAARLRGRIDMGMTVKHMLLPRAKAYCHFDELSHDVLHNAILKWTLERLAQVSGLDRRLRKELLLLHKQFWMVSDIRLTRQIFQRVTLHRNNAHYRLLMNICQLVFECALLDQKTGKYMFKDFRRDENKMAMLFERFLFNFYKREQQVYRVNKRQLHWQVSHADEESMALLPRMETDILLANRDRTIIIDAKYYRQSTREYYGNERFRSAHLYQMFSYLQNLDKRPGVQTTGVLLYPTVGRHLDHALEMHGHTIRFYTINLDQDWREIRQGLLGLLK